MHTISTTENGRSNNFCKYYFLEKESASTLKIVAPPPHIHTPKQTIKLMSARPLCPSACESIATFMGAQWRCTKDRGRRQKLFVMIWIRNQIPNLSGIVPNGLKHEDDFIILH